MHSKYNYKFAGVLPKSEGLLVLVLLTKLPQRHFDTAGLFGRLDFGFWTHSLSPHLNGNWRFIRVYVYVDYSFPVWISGVLRIAHGSKDSSH